MHVRLHFTSASKDLRQTIHKHSSSKINMSNLQNQKKSYCSLIKLLQTKLIY